MYELRAQPAEPADQWDETIRHYDLRHFYHSGAWLSYLEAAQKAERRCYGIYQAERLVGYLVGFEVKKGPVRIFGSPLPGWATPYMGPIINRDHDNEALFQAIATGLRADGFHHIEMRHFQIDTEAAASAGFQLHRGDTIIAPIPPDPDAILASFSKSTRKNIRRSSQRGLRAEFTDDVAFIDHYYEQLCYVYQKKNSKPAFPKERLRIMWDKLMPTGTMLATHILKDDLCVATRIDFCGNGSLHSFGSASHPDHLKDNPNERARYHVMCEAARRGLTRYDMTGRGSYKTRFNAEQVDIPTMIRSSALLMVGRELIRKSTTLKNTLFRHRLAGNAALSK